MPSTTLHIANPCTENWAAMTPVVTGRHCATCHTEVVDFTQKSPAEILAYLRRASGRPVCGRLHSRQIIAPVPAHRWRRWAGTLLTVSSFSALSPAGVSLAVASPSAGPAHAKTLPVQAVPGLSKRLGKRLASSSLIVRGIVLNEHTHTPVPGITILLKGTTWSTSTDADGRFELTVVPKGRHVELVAALPGYKTLVQKLSIKECQAPVTLSLKQETIWLGRISSTILPKSQGRYKA